MSSLRPCSGCVSLEFCPISPAHTLTRGWCLRVDIKLISLVLCGLSFPLLYPPKVMSSDLTWALRTFLDGIVEAGLQQGLLWVNCLVHFPPWKMELNVLLAHFSCSDSCPLSFPFSSVCQHYSGHSTQQGFCCQSSEIFRQFSSKRCPFLWETKDSALVQLLKSHSGFHWS